MKPKNRSVKRLRLLLLFWGSILLSSVLIVDEAFSTSITHLITTETGGTTQDFEYVGPDTCKTCHVEKYEAWSETGHATASDALGTNSNEECYSCHISSTIGADYFGITATNEPAYEGVSCETCHGPYDGTAGAGHMPVTLSAELCGTCHSPFHSWGHGNALEAWSKSNHVRARANLLEGGIEQPQCVHCHTAEGALPWPLGGVDTLVETENSISCPVCHNVHSAEHAYNLREEESTELCAACHEHQTIIYKGSRHDLQGAECSTCHMYGWAQDHEDKWIQVTNHTMFTWIGACGQEGCHRDPEAAWLGKNNIQAEYADIFILADKNVTAAHEAFERAKTTSGADPAVLAQAEVKLEEIDEFWHDIGLMGSQGFHNPDEMTTSIDQLILDCEEVIQLSEASVSEPNLLYLTILGFGIILLVAVLRRHRFA